MEFIRARSKEQKDIRIDHVVKAALKLYRTIPYEKINMAKIAEELDFTRANLYKYFSTKHEVFLKVIESDFKAYIRDLEKAFSGKDPLPLEKFARLWSKVFYKHERLLELVSIQFTVIEKNVSVEKLAEFKIGLFSELPKFLAIVKKQFPQFSQDELELFVAMQNIFAVGLHPSTKMSEVQKKAIAKAGISYKAPDFEDTFARFIVLTVKGLSV
jgi:AcrR family transcriptional regulator